MNGLPAIVLFIVASALAPAALAAGDCGTLRTLDRMQAAHQRLLAATRTPLPSADVYTLERTGASLDPAGINRAIRDTPLASGDENLLSFLARAQDLGQRLASGNPALARESLDDATFASLSDTVGRLLARYDCETGRFASLTGLGGDGIRGGPPGQQTRRTVPLMAYSTASFGIAVAFGLLGIYGRWRERLARRVQLHRRVSLRLGEHTGRAWLVDLSRSGAKLRKEPAPSDAGTGARPADFPDRTGTRAHLHLENADIASRIIWENGHFVGLKFHRPLARRLFQAAAAEESDEHTGTAHNTPAESAADIRSA